MSRKKSRMSIPGQVTTLEAKDLEANLEAKNLVYDQAKNLEANLEKKPIIESKTADQPKVIFSKIVNYILIVLFPVWWLVPSVLILGDRIFGLTSLAAICLFFVILFYNVFYLLVFTNWSEGETCCAAYSCEDGCSYGPDNKVPPKTDIGFGLTLWLKPLFPILFVLGVRSFGLIFYPYWSAYAFWAGLGIGAAVSLVFCILISTGIWLFREN